MSKKHVHKEVQDFRDSVKRVVALLSGKNIPVAECGNEAYVRYNDHGDPVLVNIPSIPDNASSALMNAVRGFLDHEVAHLLFTDIHVANRVKEKGKTPSKFLWNALEDVYIERKMGQVFNGTRRNLLATQRLIIEKVFEQQVDNAINESSGDQHSLFLKFFLCPVVRAWDGQSPFVDFMENYWSFIEKPISTLKKHGIDRAVRDMSSTEDCVKVAATIAQLLKNPDSEENVLPPTPDFDSDETNGLSSTAGESGVDSGNDSEIGKNLPNITNSSCNNIHDDNSDDNSSKPDLFDTNNDGTKHGKSASKQEDKKVGDEGNESDVSEAIPSTEMSLDEALEQLDKFEDEVGGMTEDALSQTINGELNSSSIDEYRPYNLSYDFMGSIDKAEEHIKRALKVFGDIELGIPLDRYQMTPKGIELFEKYIEKHLSSGVSSTLAKELERAIASRNRVQYIPGQRRGRIHGASIYRLAMNDDRVFRKKEESRAVNACVQQVIDLSGSMRGETIQLALASAYTIADALDRINVPNIITGFTTYGSPQSARAMRRVGFSRYEALMQPIIKNWNEKANSREVRTRMGCVSYTFPLMNNVDGESIANLASLFGGRQEDKKIMLVLSDGEPFAIGHGFERHLQKITKQIETQTDIDLLAIGILTKAPKKFYKNYALVTSVNSIGPSVVKELSRIILG